MRFFGLCPRLGLSSRNDAELRSTRFLRILRLVVVLRIILLCGICALAIYCWYERIQCPGLDDPITTWANINRSVLAMVLPMLLVFAACVVHSTTSDAVLKIIYKAQYSAISLRWHAMEMFGFLLFSAYGFLQMKIFGPMLSFNISEDPVMFNETASVDTICATVDRQQMVRLPQDWSWKPVAAISLMVVPIMPFLLFAMYHARWKRAKTVRDNISSNQTTGGNDQSVSTFRVRQATEPGSRETIPVSYGGVTTSTQHNPTQGGIGSENFDAPPSYESITKADAERSTTV